MKNFKKVSVLLLALAMIVGSVFVGNIKNSYAATSYKKKLNEGVTYKYDLDGDKDLDTIRIYISGDKLLLKVNNTVKTLISDRVSYFITKGEVVGYIYDFNKNDKSAEVVASMPAEDSGIIRILKFRNSTCKLDRVYEDAISINSYNPNNGMVALEEYDWGRYKEFVKGIGCFGCYDKVRINGYNAYNQYTANTISSIRERKYIAARTLTAYTSTSGSKRAFTVSKGSSVHIYALYQKGSKRYIKVKNSNGKYGYIKLSSTLMFTRDSCFWSR